jgi:hypothetical protein
MKEETERGEREREREIENQVGGTSCNFSTQEAEAGGL